MRTKLALLLLAGVVFLSMLGRRDIVTSHEGRVAQTAREMAASSGPITVPVVKMQDIGKGVMRLAPAPDEGTFQVNPWLVPILNGEIRLQKPPLPYWCASAGFKLFGVSEWAARIVPAILGFLSVLLIWDLARAVYGRRVALYSALAWVSTYFFMDEFRKAMADPYLAFSVLLAAYALNRKRPSATIVMAIAIAVGLLAKGPLIFLWLAFLIVAGWKRAQWRPLLIGLVLGTLLGGWWYFYIIRHVPHAMDLWKYESVGELTENLENVRPWWFYLPNLLLIALPWIGPAVIGVFHSQRRGWFAAIWLGIAVLFFSLVHQKKNAYLLPAAPAIAMLIGLGISALIAGVRRRDQGADAIAMIQALVGLGAGVVLIITLKNLGAVIACAIALLPVALLIRRRAQIWPIFQSIAYALLILIFSNFYVTAKENERSPRPLMLQARQIIQSNNGQIIPALLPEEASFYFPLNFKSGSGNKFYLVIDDRRDQYKPRAEKMAKFTGGRPVTSATVILTSGHRWKLVEMVTE